MSSPSRSLFLFMLLTFNVFVPVSQAASGPAIPSLSSPVDGGSLPAGQASVGLVWSVVKGATYDLEVGTSCGNTSTANWNQKDPSSKVSGLKNGTTYSWRVRSVVGKVKSAFSKCRTFSVQTPPKAPKLSKPSDGATLPAGETKASLEWTSVKGATYDLIVGTSCGDTSTAKWNQQDNSARISDLKDGTRYYWTVQSSTAEGSKSGFPDCRSFTVQSKPPVADLTVNVTLDGVVTLKWKSTGATSCSASGNGWSGAKKPTGTERVTPQTTSTYDLECTGPGGRSPRQSVNVYTVNDRPLTPYQIEVLQFIATQVVPDLDSSGSVAPNDIAARVAWWALSEGIIGDTTAGKTPVERNLNTHSNCNDRSMQLPVLESCPRNLLWQVGLAGVQAGHHDEAEIDRIIKKQWNGSKTRNELLSESLGSRYAKLDAKTKKKILESNDAYLQRSWLLRHPAIGFMAEHSTLISTSGGGCALSSGTPKCTLENRRPGGVFVKWFAATPSDVRRSLADLSDLLLTFAVP